MWLCPVTGSYRTEMDHVNRIIKIRYKIIIWGFKTKRNIRLTEMTIASVGESVLYSAELSQGSIKT